MGYNYDDYERQGMEALNAMTKREPFATRIVRLEREKAVLLEALALIVKLAEAKQEIHSCRLAIATIARAAIAQARGQR